MLERNLTATNTACLRGGNKTPEHPATLSNKEIAGAREHARTTNATLSNREIAGMKHQCEKCDEFFDEEPITSEETGKREFCSDECLQEAIDDMRIARIEAKQQWDLYGDDVDSWFR